MNIELNRWMRSAFIASALYLVNLPLFAVDCGVPPSQDSNSDGYSDAAVAVSARLGAYPGDPITVDCTAITVDCTAMIGEGLSVILGSNVSEQGRVVAIQQSLDPLCASVRL